MGAFWQRVAVILWLFLGLFGLLVLLSSTWKCCNTCDQPSVSRSVLLVECNIGRARNQVQSRLDYML
jgi:hypothetical protein